MSNPLVNDDDLDPNFTPDPNILNGAGSSAPVQLVTKVDAQKEPEVKPGPSIEQLINTKLVEVKDNATKVTNLQDVHDAIVAAEAICLNDAESIHLATESFFNQRMPANSFTDVRSSINYVKSKTYLENKISEIKSINKTLMSSIATESVNEYVTSITNKVAPGILTVKPHEKAVKSQKGIFIAKNNSMVNINKETLSNLFEFIQGSTISIDLKNALIELGAVSDKSKVVTQFISYRVSGLSTNDSVNSIKVNNTECPEIDVETLIKYYSTYLVEDMQEIDRLYANYKECLTTEVNNIIESPNTDPVEFVQYISGIMNDSGKTEILEQLLFKIPLLVAVINKVVEAAKF